MWRPAIVRRHTVKAENASSREATMMCLARRCQAVIARLASQNPRGSVWSYGVDRGGRLDNNISRTSSLLLSEFPLVIASNSRIASVTIPSNSSFSLSPAHRLRQLKSIQRAFYSSLSSSSLSLSASSNHSMNLPDSVRTFFIPSSLADSSFAHHFLNTSSSNISISYRL